MLTPDLKHHSPSSISSFIEYRGAWFLKVFQGQKPKTNENMARGTAVEEGINFYIGSDEEDEEVKIQQSIVAAHKKFAEETIGLEIMPFFRETINGLVKKGIESTNKFKGECIQIQKKIELKIDGVTLPIIGYLDWEYPSYVYDNKVTGKTPSKLKQGYIIQGSIYRAATNKPVIFHFIIDLKGGPEIKVIKLTDEDFDYGLRLATKAAKAIERIVDSAIDGETMKALMFPNPSAYWKADEVKAILDEWKI